MEEEVKIMNITGSEIELCVEPVKVENKLICQFCYAVFTTGFNKQRHDLCPMKPDLDPVIPVLRLLDATSV